MADFTVRDAALEVVVDYTPPFVQYIVTSAELTAPEVVAESAAVSVSQIPGPDGEEGAEGAPGPHGPVGPSGLAGETGAQGAQGPPGIDGDAAEDGWPGAHGETGAAGAQGSPGWDGDHGDEGIIGPPGRDGITPSIAVALDSVAVSVRNALNFMSDEDTDVSVLDNSANARADISISAQRIADNFRLLLCDYVDKFGDVPNGLEEEYERAVQLR